MATIQDHFRRDFRNPATCQNEWPVEHPDTGETLTVIARIHYDTVSYSRYVSFLAPHSEKPEQLCGYLVNNAHKAMESIASGASMYMGQHREELVPMHEAGFSNTVYIYVDDPLPDDAIQRLVEYGKQQGLVVRIRPHQYAERYRGADNYHAFLSHDSRDKADVARPLAVALDHRLCNVWLDEFTLKIGDSLRESIQNGIKRCSKCILVLSPNFLANGGWTKAEFDMIFSREIVEKGHVILPIWHNVTKEQVYEYCPLLVDRFAGDTSIGIEALADKLVQALKAAKQ